MAVRWNINHKIAAIKAMRLFVINNNVELPMAPRELEECFRVCQRALGYERRKLYRDKASSAVIKGMIDEVYPRTQDEILFCIVDKGKGIKKHRELNDWDHLTVDSEMKLIPPVHEFMSLEEPVLSPEVPVVTKGYNKKAKANMPVYRKEDIKLVVIIGLREMDKASVLKRYNGKPIELHCVQSDSPNKLKQACSKQDADMFVLFTNFMHHSSYQLIKNSIKQKNKIQHINGGFSSLFPILDGLIYGENYVAHQ